MIPPINSNGQTIGFFSTTIGKGISRTQMMFDQAVLQLSSDKPHALFMHFKGQKQLHVMSQPIDVFIQRYSILCAYAISFNKGQLTSVIPFLVQVGGALFYSFIFEQYVCASI